jgi:hypothetical protein
MVSEVSTFETDLRVALGAQIHDDAIARAVYAALANVTWYHPATHQVYTCTFRYAGSLIAQMRGEGCYLDWYCGSPEGEVPDVLRRAMKKRGWIADALPDICDEGDCLRSAGCGWYDGTRRRLTCGQHRGTHVGKTAGAAAPTLPRNGCCMLPDDATIQAMTGEDLTRLAVRLGLMDRERYSHPADTGPGRYVTMSRMDLFAPHEEVAQAREMFWLLRTQCPTLLLSQSWVPGRRGGKEGYIEAFGGQGHWAAHYGVEGEAVALLRVACLAVAALGQREGAERREKPCVSPVST